MRRWTFAAALTLAAVGIAPVRAGSAPHADDCHLTPNCAAPCDYRHAEPSCAAPCPIGPAECAPTCAPQCRPRCCHAPKKSFLARLWDLEKRKNACIGDTFFDWVD
ncbi:MAG: hypothetical protein WBC44_12895 [Planctomycetaceae bacterium]